MNILHTLWNLACTIAANFKFILGKGAPYRAPFCMFFHYFTTKSQITVSLIPHKGDPKAALKHGYVLKKQ